jgi:hypothetical protein
MLLKGVLDEAWRAGKRYVKAKCRVGIAELGEWCLIIRMIKSLLLAMFAISAVVNASTLDVGLLAHYTFDGNALDQSGNGHDGVASNISYGLDRFSDISTKALYMNSLNCHLLIFRTLALY